MPIGVLLAQLGTPAAPTPGALRSYLREFLGDPRVLDLPPLLRALLLYLVILPFRPRRSAALYRRIWTEGGSPLLVHSRAQARGLACRLGPGFSVALAMRYGRPRLEEAFEGLLRSGIRRVIVLPLFPQYASSTTASVLDAVARSALRRRDVPALRIVRDFATDPGYIGALARRVRRAAAGRTDEAPLLLSFHGEPVRFLREGDPYRERCEATAAALARTLGLPSGRWRISYQSRFGREEWIGPATEDVLAELARRGTRRVVVATPGFVADCLETIDEIGREAAHRFREAGGEELVRVPCLNDDPAWLDALADLVRREAAGWEEPPAARSLRQEDRSPHPGTGPPAAPT